MKQKHEQAKERARAKKKVKALVEMWKLPTVQRRTGVSKPMIYYGMRNNTFPKSRKLGKRAVAWRSDEIQDWIESREVA